jgi:hypothetical protein
VAKNIRTIDRPKVVGHEDDVAGKLEHLRYLHSLAERYKDSVITRSQVLLAVAGGQLAAAITIANTVWAKIPQSKFGAAFLILFIASITVQLFAVTMVLFSILPLGSLKAVSRIISRTSKSTHCRDAVSLMSSFNHVVNVERDDFLKVLTEADLQTLFHDLTITYYNLCCIVNRRYLRLRFGIIVQMWGLFLVILQSIAMIFIPRL